MIKVEETKKINPASEAIQRDILKFREQGIDALKRLLRVAQRDTGQSSVIARFLLCLYNSRRFLFDLTDFQRLDQAIFDDCVTVLRMDCAREKEIHLYFDNGAQIFEQLAIDWNFHDFNCKK